MDRGIQTCGSKNNWVSHYEIFPEIGDEWKKYHQDCLNGISHRKEEDKFIREDGSVQWFLGK
jgi:hypothetical protein